MNDASRDPSPNRGTSTTRPRRSALEIHWSLDPRCVYLNHGSFGAAPRTVVAARNALLEELEHQPFEFFVRSLPRHLARTRNALSHVLGAHEDGIALVSNATEGVNAVLRSLQLNPGDELLTTDHAYNACRNSLEFIADRAGARVTIATIPFPLSDPDEVVEAVLAAVTPATRYALLDHITSPTGLILPIEALVSALESRGIAVLVDGAHAPGMVPLQLDALGASWYTGNFHKWLCAPRGAAFLHTRADRRDETRPLCISHGATMPTTDRARYLNEFDWLGTADPTPALVLPECIAFLESLDPDGLPGIQARNHALALRARDHLAERLGVTPPAPDAMLGSLAALPLPPSPGPPPASVFDPDPLYDTLLNDWGIEVMIPRWPDSASRLIRISAHAYNAFEEYAYLADALLSLLDRESG